MATITCCYDEGSEGRYRQRSPSPVDERSREVDASHIRAKTSQPARVVPNWRAPWAVSALIGPAAAGALSQTISGGGANQPD